MDQAPFARLTRNARWQTLALMGLLPVALLLLGALLWGGMRVLEQERSRLELDFNALIAYLQEQEDFLHQLQHQSEMVRRVPVAQAAELRKLPAPSGWDVQLYEGQESAVDLPFTFACAPSAACQGSNATVLSLGSYLANFYATYWASSYFPAAAVFFVSRTEDLSLGVPAIGAFAGYEPISVDVYRSTTRVVRDALQSGDVPVRAHDAARDALHAHVDPNVQWFAIPGAPEKMVGVLAAGFQEGLWSRQGTSPADVFLASLLSRERLNAFKHRGHSGDGYAFWLAHRDQGVLMGEGGPPVQHSLGLSLRMDGLVWKGQDARGDWTGSALVSYRSFFYKNWWLLAGGAMVMLWLVIGGIWYTRWYRRHVLAPAEEAQRQIMESDAFNRTLVETAPVGLCVLQRDTGAVVFINTIAQRWLDLAQSSAAGAGMGQQLKHICSMGAPGVSHGAWQVADKHLSLAYAPSVYREQRVMVCAFMDMTDRVQIEQELARAKQAADEASEAKSMFLSTMSHEIRTPLYGLQGTVELLTSTEMDARQRLYVGRIQEASQLLLQLISDILDMGKIEAGQLSLELTTFSPRELVQNCLRSYAGMAQRKGLLLFSCVDLDIPALVEGDAVRIRQILSNLVSNAIKFTDVGRVAVQVHAHQVEAGRVQMRFEVYDTGIGIEKEQQGHLFQPFFMVEGRAHTGQGAGLGLSICERLAKLMDASIHVRSEYQIGSCFTLELPLKVQAARALQQPNLKGCQVVVRTPHDALSRNLAAWLRFWGAEVEVAEDGKDALMAHQEAAAWIDLFMHRSSQPAQLTGLYLCLDPMQEPSSHPEIDGQSVLSIAQGLERLLLNVALVQQELLTQRQLGMKVLVAEDNPINQMTLRDQLEQLGCQVTLADDGEDALAMWDMEAHDVVLTDVNMPRMNGYELARTLRAEGVRSPIVGITANAMQDEKQRCRDAGMDVCVVKPITLDALAKLLQQFQGIHADGVTADVGQEPAGAKVQVPAKYRQLFLETMLQDVGTLSDALKQGQADKVVYAVHRMSGALVDVGHVVLAQRLQKLEESLKAHGLTDSAQSDVADVLEALHQLLSEV